MLKLKHIIHSKYFAFSGIGSKPLLFFFTIKWHLRYIFIALSLGLIIPRGQSVSGHVVQAKMWGLEKNPQKWDKSETALISGGGFQLKTSVSHVKAKNTPLKDTEKGRESSKECLVFF